MIQYSMVDSLILLDARREVGVIGGVIRMGHRSRLRSKRKGLNHGGHRGTQGRTGGNLEMRSAGFRIGRLFLVWAKKCGAGSGDPNLRFQPRLPGSVVGEASMRQVAEGDKITRVTVRW